MQHIRRKLISCFCAPILRAKDQLVHMRKQIIMLIIAFIMPLSAEASMSCKGRFVNPISDICWRCVLPISIGNFSLGKGSSPAKRDTKNPSSPVCMCIKGTPPLPVPGISLGFWEPVRLVDITRTPYWVLSHVLQKLINENRLRIKKA